MCVEYRVYSKNTFGGLLFSGGVILLELHRSVHANWFTIFFLNNLFCSCPFFFSVTKLSIVGSILFIVVQKRIVELSTAEVLLIIACVGSFLQVLMYLSNTNDPFTYLEKGVAAVFFREPTEKANTSDSKKKED